MYPLKLFILLFIFVCELLVETLEMDFVNHKSKVNKSQRYVHERLLLPIGRSRKLPPLTRNGITLSINNYPIVLVFLEKKNKNKIKVLIPTIKETKTGRLVCCCS
jgi:hypothetical protein